MKYSSNKEINQQVRKLMKAGWQFHKGRKHGRLTPPGGGGSITISSSPSDYRAIHNFRRDIRSNALK